MRLAVGLLHDGGKYWGFKEKRYVKKRGDSRVSEVKAIFHRRCIRSDVLILTDLRAAMPT